jgi:hypothetical protein
MVMDKSKGHFLAGGLFMLAGVIGIAAENYVFASFFGVGTVFLALGAQARKAS